MAGQIQASWSQVEKYNGRCSGVNCVIEVFNAAQVCHFQKSVRWRNASVGNCHSRVVRSQYYITRTPFGTRTPFSMTAPHNLLCAVLTSKLVLGACRQEVEQLVADLWVLGELSHHCTLSAGLAAPTNPTHLRAVLGRILSKRIPLQNTEYMPKNVICNVFRYIN